MGLKVVLLALDGFFIVFKFLKILYFCNMFTNYNADEDFIKLYKSIATFFAYYVILARKYAIFYENEEFLLEQLRQKGLILVDDESFDRLTFYMKNYFSEMRKRGTLKIIERAGLDESESFSESGSLEENLNGELLRLIDFDECDEFIFNLRKGNKIGWNIANSSPLYKGTSNMENLNKIWSQLLDLDDYLNFPLINSDYITSVQDSIDDTFDESQSFSESESSTFIDEDYVIKIIPSSNTNPIGIGIDPTDKSKANAYGIVVNPSIDYEFEFRIKTNKLLAGTFTENVIDTFAVGNEPDAIVLSPDNSKLFVANYSDGTIDVVDTSNDTIVHTITLLGDSNQPFDLCINNAGTKLFVANRGNNSVEVYNSLTYAYIVGIGINAPQNICISPDDSTIYITQYYNNNIVVVNTISYTPTHNISTGNQPWGICISPDGTKGYVSIHGTNKVSVFSTSTFLIITTISVDINPIGICISPDGTKVYAACSGDNTISIIDALTNTFVSTIPVGSVPHAIKISQDGTRLCVTNSADATIKILDASTNVVLATVSVGNYPYSLCINSLGTKVYVANWLDNTVTVISMSESADLATIEVGINAFDCSGNKENLESIVDFSTTTEFSDSLSSLKQVGYYYSFRGIIYSQSRFNAFDNLEPYKMNVIVHSGTSYYRSKSYVPSGILVTNTVYWEPISQNELADLLYPLHFDGNNLKFTSGVRKIIPYVKVTSNTSDLLIYLASIRLQPVATDYSTGFIQIMNWIDFWLTINNQNYTEDQIKQLLRDFLLPYDAQDFEFNQPILK